MLGESLRTLFSFMEVIKVKGIDLYKAINKLFYKYQLKRLELLLKTLLFYPKEDLIVLAHELDSLHGKYYRLTLSDFVIKRK